MMLRRFLRGLVAGVAGVGLAAAVASPAFADPPGPTDYQSEIVSIDPPTPAIEVGIIGGDSFVELRVDVGTDAMVLGYQGEDYLWFRPDGVVLENQNSPATYLNADRYGDQLTAIPEGASADAEPSWKQVATGGYWAWHDHRAHWMQSVRPFGRSAGDQILEAVIPIVVDGDTVEVEVISTWQPEPSPVAMWLGVVAGLGTAGGAWLLRRRARGSGDIPPIVAGIPLVVLTVGVGTVQYLSLPSATGPRPIWFVLPLVAAVSTAVGLVLSVRGARFAADAALLVVAVELAVWGFVKRDGLSAAIVPTDAPFWLDRFATAAALAGGVALAAIALWWLFAVPAPGSESASADPYAEPVSDSRAPSDSRRPAHP
jgi:hypothetical protein